MSSRLHSPVPILYAEHRLAIARLLVNLAGRSREMYGLHDGYENVLIGACVLIGHIEHKPMSAGKIAAYLDLPRTTVMRRLDNMTRGGNVRRSGRVYCLAEDHQPKTTIVPQIFRQVREIVATAEKLSRMGTSASQ